MDAEKPSGSSGPDAKRRKRSDERGPSRIAAIDAPDAVATNVEQTGAIFKLDIDCFEESFDYLSYRDLVKVGKTCKRLQQVAGYCFQQNYLGDNEAFDDSDIQVCMETSGENVNVGHFAPSIERITIFWDWRKKFMLEQSKFRSLKHIKMRGLDLTNGKIDGFGTKAIWNNLGVLRSHSCKLDSSFHEILNLCTKLKRLEIHELNDHFNWFDRKYETLECLEFAEYQARGPPNKLSESIPLFLELSPNIRKFATNSTWLWLNRDAMLTSNVKLDELAIDFYDKDLNIFGYEGIKAFCDLLNKLHKLCKYRKLQFYCLSYEFDQEQVNHLATLNGLNKLSIDYRDDAFVSTKLKNLEELYLFDIRYVADLENFPNDLVNLKRIYFYHASIDDIMPFIKRSVHMQKIKVNHLNPGGHFDKDTRVINLSALNREREELALNREHDRLPNPQKITLYVQEEIYLATKWAMKGNDFGLIRLKRKESIQWDHDFDR